MIERVVAPNPGSMTLDGTNTYLVGDATDELAVIDPGPDDQRHLAAIVATASRLGRKISTVLVTHRHMDHLPAAIPLCRETGATLVGHAALPGVQRATSDGLRAFGDLTALETPGHTRDSLCFWNASDGALFTGDLVAGTGTVVLDDQPDALSAYLGSLQRLVSLGPRTIYPGHGPIVDDALGKLTEYLEHRQQRLQQVVQALVAFGPATIEQLVRAIYPDVPSNVRTMAARNVRANLSKLAADGRVRALSGDRWQLTD